MKSELLNYKPEAVEYVLDDVVAETFPRELDFLSLDGDALMGEKKLQTKRDVLNLPVRKAELEEAIEKAKKLKKDAEDALAAVVQDIAAYAAQVKQGTKELLLKSKDTFCISLAGYYLVYTWDEQKQTFVLASGYEVTDQSEIFADDRKNREMMLQLFGAEFAETPRKQQNADEEMPFGREE